MSKIPNKNPKSSQPAKHSTTKSKGRVLNLESRRRTSQLLQLAQRINFFNSLNQKPKQNPKYQIMSKIPNKTPNRFNLRSTQPEVRIHDSNRDESQPESRRRPSQLLQLAQRINFFNSLNYNPNKTPNHLKKALSVCFCPI